MRRLYHNGSILTMEDRDPRAAFLITNGNTIEYVGEETSCSGNFDEIIDLQGRCLLPGFIDAHSHFLSLASSLMQISLDGVLSVEEIGQRIRQYMHTRKPRPGQWIHAKGYDHTLLPGKAHLHRAFLDQLCPDDPLVLQHASGHMGVFNSAALTALAVTAETPSPDGGRIVYDSGLMEENAYFSYVKKIPMPGLDALLSACREAQEIYASYGITTLQEGMMVKEMLPLYQAILGSGLLKLDVVGYADVRDADLLYAELGAEDTPHFRLGGLKIFLDGSPQGRTAWMRQPYADSTDCGYGTMSTEAVEAALTKAAREKRQLLAHCNGDAACAQLLSALAKVGSADSALCDLRPVIIHAQLIGLDQLAQAKALGAIPSFFVAHIRHWGDLHLRNFGTERASHISPCGTALAHGLPFTFHQDTPVIPPNMLESIDCAVNRITAEGQQLAESEKIPVWEALKAVTIHAAYQYFQENEKGSLRAGKRADLVILDADPLRCDPRQLSQLRVCQTIKDGTPVFSI